MTSDVCKQNLCALNGDEAVAYAVKQSDVDVVAAYPITPQTIIVERFGEYVANGEVQTEFVCTESEHTALAACLAASCTGARTFTASASAGLALMHEMLAVTSGLRMPVVMAVANRALSAPLNINGDQSDGMAQRDTGWIQIYVENAQEAYDSIIQAFRISEDTKISLPTMIGLDGFIVSHTLENVELLPDNVVKEFLGDRQFLTVTDHQGNKVPLKLDPDNPLTMGSVAMPNYYFEFKRQQEQAMINALDVIQKVHNEYAKISGRSYGNALIEPYRLEDAEIATIVVGSAAGTMKSVVDELRNEGIKAGLLRLRTFRPFPKAEIQNALSKINAIAVMDRSMSFGGNGGAVFQEIRHSLYESDPKPFLINYIYGLGGRDSSPKEFRKVYSDLIKIQQTGQAGNLVRYLGLRE